jgi:hypothetical protein
VQPTWSIRSEFQSNHQPKTARFFQDRGKLTDQSLQLCHHETTDLPGVITQAITLDNFENFEGHGAPERVPAEG